VSTLHLNVLDNIRIASPCSARWEDMKGDERVRHCEQCNLNVFNLSEMTRQEAQELVIHRQGRLCARLWRRADGTIITRDCPVGLAAVRARTARIVARIAAALGLLLTGGALLASRTRDPEARLSDRQPFATLIKWLDPDVQAGRGQTQWMGDIDISPPPSPAGSR
jgi:hypothetical protein